jgi:hypothetical protein
MKRPLENSKPRSVVPAILTDIHFWIPAGRVGLWALGASLDSLIGLRTAPRGNTQVDASRLRKLQFAGILSGFAAGAWLGAAEAPTKLVNLGISPVIISLLMVSGVFLARWTLPALIRGTAQMRVDARQAPHLILWGVLAGCLWAVANTLTVFAIRDIGLSVAFPHVNLNISWNFLGLLLFRELRGAEKARSFRSLAAQW